MTDKPNAPAATDPAEPQRLSQDEQKMMGRALFASAERLDAPAATAQGAEDGPKLRWLIERGQRERQTPTIWFSAGGGEEKYGYLWTEDASRANFYATEAEASAAIQHEFARFKDDPRVNCRATEHMWLDGPTAVGFSPGADAVPPPDPSAIGRLIVRLQQIQPGFDGCITGHKLAQEAVSAIVRLRESNKNALLQGCKISAECAKAKSELARLRAEIAAMRYERDNWHAEYDDAKAALAAARAEVAWLREATK